MQQVSADLVVYSTINFTLNLLDLFYKNRAAKLSVGVDLKSSGQQATRVRLAPLVRLASGRRWAGSRSRRQCSARCRSCHQDRCKHTNPVQKI